MEKLSIEELDAIVKQSSLPLPQDEENQPKTPALRKPVDKALNAAKTVGAGALGIVSAVGRIKPTLNTQTID